ncbi:NAD(P)-binding protein [candidate division WOR-3 bacterium]|uniref:NAD(P)-binding protein n=1 Tax=candidate division WOR-3 bacterium TaxID=2052148 RepID=A0A9D5QDR2_UNCW3|nr:NAD(P)-binding protein [candidate division WOR-3 bacterium]MBD3365337.1 NAD(P)-binding protein [candidate division WOR-3 bacterium]
MSFNLRERRVRELKRRRLYLLLSLVIPGTGQLAAGRIGIGITGLILNALFVITPIFLIPRLKENNYSQYVFLVWLLIGAAFLLYYFIMALDAYRGTRLAIAPCRGKCPADINVPDYVALVAAGRHSEADELIRERAPFAATLGRICPAPCEDVCTRTRIEEPIAIRALKRSAQERRTDHTVPTFEVQYPQKIAVIGAGPSGLTCAYFLGRLGYKVDVFDSSDTPGGLLASTIPCFRLPRKALAEDIGYILHSSEGVRFHGGRILGKDLDLTDLEKAYDAVYLAMGASRPRPLMLEGEGLKGVIPGLEFLRKVCSGKETYKFKGHVAVLGGGNTAVDSARAALRLGAKKVIVFYRRAREHMPAYAGEVEEAEREGVEFRFLAGPLSFEGRGKVRKLHLCPMKLVEHSHGRRSEIIPLTEERWIETVEAVIVAVGQEADYSMLETLTVASDVYGKITVHPHRLHTSRRNIFAGGDAVNGPSTVVEAVADGRRAAKEIDLFLRPRFLGRQFARLNEFDLDFGIERLEGAAWKKKKPEVRERFSEILEVKKIALNRETLCGLAPGEDRKEALRCLRCHKHSIGFGYKKGKQKEYVPLDKREE